jgi:hypothetical protein
MSKLGSPLRHLLMAADAVAFCLLWYLQGWFFQLRVTAGLVPPV